MVLPDVSVVDDASALLQSMPSRELVPNRWFVAARPNGTGEVP